MFDMFGLEKDHKIAYGEEVAHLTTVYDVAMLGMIRGLLEDADIPYLVHERATGSAMRIMTGFSLYGTDIFVPKAAEETARDLIAGIDTDGEGAEPVTILEDEKIEGEEQ
ncbi:MAG: DUF2007 domain-containing protein [Clostridia bacterium]|nr:DUF2007 domain-containing protein [Clostridia bacterium]